jgi:hypothetical protein
MGALSKCEDNTSPVRSPSKLDAFDGERTKIETTNNESEGSTMRRAMRLSGRRIYKATKLLDVNTLYESVQALTVVFEIYSLAQASSRHELYNPPYCRIIEDGLRNLLSNSYWKPFSAI